MNSFSTSETKGSVYNAQRNFSASNVVKKCALYTGKYGIYSSKKFFPCDCTSVGLSTHPSAPQGIQCEISHFLASMGACNLTLHFYVVINWQMSKQGIHWPVSDIHTADSGVDPSRLHGFLKLSSDKLLVSTNRRLNLTGFLSNCYKFIGWSRL